MKRIDFDTIDSTNEEAKRRIRAADIGDIFDTVITARAQTAGKGRRGRDFFSPGTGDSVYLSFVLRPPSRPEALQLLTIAAAACVCRVIEESVTITKTPKPTIKWVNDILLEHKKICGILAEGVSAAAPELTAVILGVGVNINVPVQDFPEALRKTAGSLQLPASEREGFAQLLCKKMFETCAEIDGGAAALLTAYRTYETTTGHRVFVTKYADGSSVPAFAKAIADDGGLVVVYADGSEETLHSGEVSVL